MKNIIKKADIILFIVLVLLGAILTVGSFMGSSDKTQVVITVDGKIYGTYPLSKNQTIIVEEDDRYNQVVIEDGQVHMHEANCDNQLCVKQGIITTNSIPIICLPNRVIVVIDSGEEDIDVLAR